MMSYSVNPIKRAFLSNHNFSTKSWDQFCERLSRENQVTHLFVKNVTVKNCAPSLRVFFKALKFHPSLVHLSLENCFLGDQEAIDIEECIKKMKFNNLKSLSLVDNQIPNNGVLGIISAIHKQTKDKFFLDLSKNFVDQELLHSGIEKGTSIKLKLEPTLLYHSNYLLQKSV